MEQRLTDAETAALKALVEIIKTNPRIVRLALELGTDDDHKAIVEERQEFEQWRSREITRLRERGMLG